MDWFLLAVVLVFIVAAMLPIVGYFVAKFGTAGYLAARRFFNKENERDERQRRS